MNIENISIQKFSNSERSYHDLPLLSDYECVVDLVTPFLVYEIERLKTKDGKALYQIALLESLQQKFVQHRISKGYFDLFCAGHFPLLPCQAQFLCSSMLDT